MNVPGFIEDWSHLAAELEGLHQVKTKSMKQPLSRGSVFNGPIGGYAGSGDSYIDNLSTQSLQSRPEASYTSASVLRRSAKS